MSLFKRLFGPDEPEEAPDGEVAIEPAQDQSLSPMTPGELAALESSSRSVTLPAGERVTILAAAGYRKAPNAAGCQHPSATSCKAISPELTKRFRACRGQAPATLSNPKTDSRNLAA